MKPPSLSGLWRAGARPAWLSDWAGDSALLLISQIAATVATSVLAILIARSLEPHDWGIFSGFLALSISLSVFAEFGLTAWLLRELSHLATTVDLDLDQGRRQAGRLVGGGFALTSLLGALFIAGTAVAAFALRLDVELFVAVVSLVAYGAVRSGSTSLEAYFRSRRRLRRVVAALLIEKGVLLVLIALVVSAGFGLVGVALAYPIAGLARVLVNAVNIIGRKEIIVSQTRLGDLRHVLSGSFPFALNRASLNVVPQLDAFVLAVFSPTGAGYFALGNRILGPIQIVPFVFSSTLYPFLARESKGSRAGWAAVVLLGAGGLVIAAIGIVVAPFLVPFIFGSEYRNAVPVVQVMLVALPFIFAANSLLVHVYSSRREGRGLTVLLAAISVTGTVAIVTGQILIGPLAAAGGYLLRHALFTGTLVVAGSLPGRPAPGSLAESNGIRELSHAATRSAP